MEHVHDYIGVVLGTVNTVLLLTLSYRVGRWQGVVDTTIVHHDRRISDLEDRRT